MFLVAQNKAESWVGSPECLDDIGFVRLGQVLINLYQNNQKPRFCKWVVEPGVTLQNVF